MQILSMWRLLGTLGSRWHVDTVKWNISRTTVKITSFCNMSLKQLHCNAAGSDLERDIIKKIYKPFLYKCCGWHAPKSAVLRTMSPAVWNAWLVHNRPQRLPKAWPTWDLFPLPHLPPICHRGLFGFGFVKFDFLPGFIALDLIRTYEFLLLVWRKHAGSYNLKGKLDPPVRQKTCSSLVSTMPMHAAI